jgi:Bacterial Ig-like domain (group 3)
MKGIPSLQRLKRFAAVAGVGALVVGGAVLGTTQANAAVTQFGTGTGLTLSPATGAATATLGFSSTACPSGDNGSATVNVLDPTTPAGTSVQNIPADQVSGVIVPASTAFSGTFNTTLAGLYGLGINVAPGGAQFEVAVECFSDAAATQNGTYVQSTFVTIAANGTYTANQAFVGAPQAVNLVLTANPNPATAGQSVTLTATASVAGATGTVQFENNGTDINGPATISGGVATTSTTFAAAATENLTAVYTPTGSFTAGTGGSLSLVVGAAPANSGTIPLAVSVPVTGSFTLTVDTTDLVNLTATGLTAAGVTTPIGVSDTRNTFPGWSVSGQDAAWTGTGTAAGGTFSGNQLGWAPTDTVLAQGVTLGATVAPAAPGLGTAATLASVHAGIGNGYGTSTLGANLSLVIPPTVPAGPYTSGLTISAVTSNP